MYLESEAPEQLEEYEPTDETFVAVVIHVGGVVGAVSLPVKPL